MLKEFKYLNKMMIRTIKDNIMQLLAIIVIGAIAVTLFVGLIANASAFENQVNHVYSSGNLSDIWVTTTKYDEKDQKVLNAYLEDDEKVEGRLYVPCTSGGKNIYLTVVHELPSISKPYGELELSSSSTEQDFLYLNYDLKVSDDVLYKQGLYNLDDSYTFSLDISSYNVSTIASALDALGYVKEGGKNIFLEDNINFTSKVTGFMHHPENITKANYNTSVVLMSDHMFRTSLMNLLHENFKEDVVETIYNMVSSFIGFNRLDAEYLTNPNQYVIDTNSSRNVDELQKLIENYFKNKSNNNLYMVSQRGGMPFYMTINADVSQAKAFTFVFPMVFYLVAVLVILTTLSQMVLKDRNKIGTLKALGIRNSMIMLHYVSLTVVLVLLGIIIGEILGPIIIPPILGTKYGLIYSLPPRQYTFPWAYGLISGLIFLLVAVVVTMIICRKEISLKPSESMRPAVSKYSVKLREKPIKSKLYAPKMALRNIFMHIPKSAMVVIGVLGCTALLVCGFGIEDTINNGINQDKIRFYTQDINVTFNANKSKAEVSDELDAMEEIKCYEFYNQATTSASFDSTQIECAFFLIADDSTFKKVDFDVNEVALSKKHAEKLNVQVGDKINFTYGSKTYSSIVGTIYESFVYNGLMIHESNSCLGESKLKYQYLSIDVKDGYDVNVVKEKLLKLSFVKDTITQVEWQNTVKDLMSGIYVMTNAIKVFAIILGIVVLYNLTLLNYKERSRDIATLKVLGFSRLEILNSLILEGLGLTFVGVTIGLIVGYPFLLAVMLTNKVALVDYLYHIYPVTYLISFALTFGVAFIINLILSYRIKKIQMVESLKSVE